MSRGDGPWARQGRWAAGAGGGRCALLGAWLALGVLAALLLLHPIRRPRRKAPGLKPAWPRVFLIAAPKAGTSSLAQVLFRHPSLCSPDTPSHKEVDFFSRKEEFERGPARYTAHWAGGFCAGRVPVDASPTYLRSRGAAQRIRQTIPSELHSGLRFVAVLREPIACGLSFYNQQRALGLANASSFGAHVALQLRLVGRRWNDLEAGFYADDLERWFEVFPRSQTFVVSFDSLLLEPEATLLRLGAFLGLEGGEWARLSRQGLPWKNAQRHEGKLSVGDIDPDTCRRLSSLYAPHNARLLALLSQPGSPPQQPPFPPFRSPCAAG